MDSSMRGDGVVHPISDRLFGCVMGTLLGILGVLPLVWGAPAKGVLVGIAAALFLAGLLWPSVLKWPRILWLWFTGKIAMTVNFLLLGIIFFGVVTPVALFFRVIGRDPLRRRWEPEAVSYWVERASEIPASMKNQF